MLLVAQNLKKDFGIQRIINIEKLEIKEGDRIGFVGRNGVGKSTLFGILTGDVRCDSGTIKRYCEIAIIKQNGETDGESDGKYISQMRLKDSAIMSGGEKTRLAIAAAFSKHTPLLLADEPTTNLDLHGIQMLEKMLKGYKGAVVVISHDRQLLDQTCNQIWELEDGVLRIFSGNYSSWLEQRKRELDFCTFEYEQYRTEKKRLEKAIQETSQKASKMCKPPRHMGSSEWILYKGTVSIQQGHVQGSKRALNSRLEHLEKKERPKEMPHISMKLGSFKPIKSKVAARVEGLSIEYHGKSILMNGSMNILAGKRTFLIGENGTGKTSIINSILRKEEHTFITNDAKIGYFSQEQDTLNKQETVLENVISTAAVPKHICRAILMNLYMDENDINKKVEVLSGGERVKTAIAKILASECNMLILDEPTNHMDVYTMEGLEQMLRQYGGTLLVVTHDRKLLDNLGQEIYEIKDGQISKVEFSKD